ncbi:RagB/SusD family nutrient uptake outer membrane protein [Fibrella rubiginis]|nr:RagB/SusD family nutrient uptake outer membrane protein [Fibrella rubiginis]
MIRNSHKYMLLSLGLWLGSCQVNDLQPQTALSETTAFQTPERLELTVAGVYDGAQSGFYNGSLTTGVVRGYPFGAAHLEQGDMRGEDMVSVQAFYAVTYRSTYDASSPNNGFFWQTTYAMINRANVVLAGLETAKPTAALTQAQIDAYKGEMRFLRALGHHYLLVFFARPFGDNPTAANGGIPYRTQPVTGGATVDQVVQQGRNTVSECYDKLIEDLNYAESVLPATRTNKITRATQGAAIALKMRVRLHQNNWAEVIKEGNKLVPATGALTSPIGAYQLTASPLGAFGAGNKNNTESIFSIENNDVDNGGVNGAPASMYNASGVGGRGIIAISPILWNQPFFPATDLRKSAAAVASDAPSAAGRGGNFSRKYVDVVNRSDNAPIIRYAEVLLTMAEALARTTPSDPRALTLLSAVRNRANTDAASQYTAASFATGTDLVRAIINERRPEFLAEGMRWLDIHRLSTDATYRQATGIPAKANNTILNFAPLYTNNPATTFALLPAIAYTDRLFVWPLPQEEILNNPVLSKQQNPGY